jgi:hypothetical protein
VSSNLWPSLYLLFDLYCDYIFILCCDDVMWMELVLDHVYCFCIQFLILGFYHHRVSVKASSHPSLHLFGMMMSYCPPVILYPLIIILFLKTHTFYLIATSTLI